MTDIKLGEVRANNRRRSMSRKTRRLYLVLVSLVLLGGAVALVLAALRQDIVFFLSPTELAAKPPASGRVIRIGGLVERGSLQKLGGGAVLFEVTDLSKSVKVRYRGILPDLFREGQGVVIEGAVNEQGEFIANEVLAKHDEKYLPPEVAKALKASGRWQEKGDQAGSDSPGGNSTGNNEGSGPR